MGIGLGLFKANRGHNCWTYSNSVIFNVYVAQLPFEYDQMHIYDQCRSGRISDKSIAVIVYN